MRNPTGQYRETIDGNVWARLGMQGAGVMGEVLGRSGELNGTGSGDVGWWEVGLGDGRYSRGLLSSAVVKGRPRGTMKWGEHSLCLLLMKWVVGGREQEKILHKIEMTGHKDFF